MIVERITAGELETNCYIVFDDSKENMVIIDPGFFTEKLKSRIQENIDIFRAILLTHMHFDHISGIPEIKKIKNVPVYLHHDDLEGISDYDKNCYNLVHQSYKDFSEFKADVLVSDAEKLKIGNLVFEVICTPGHTKGSVSYAIDNCIFSGDMLFKMTVGATRFFSSSKNDMKNSLKKMYGIEKDYVIYPGHGEETSLFYEKENNPYFWSLRR